MSYAISEREDILHDALQPHPRPSADTIDGSSSDAITRAPSAGSGVGNGIGTGSGAGVGSASASNINAPRIRRRNRIITSCLECRRRKLKCDRSHPCNHCSKASRDCVFLAPALDSSSKSKLNQFKERLESLEKGLGDQALGGDVRSLYVSSRDIDADTAKHDENFPVPEDEKNLEPTPLAIEDIAYEDDADDGIDDLGIRLGKMKMTERIGGFVRPRLSEEIADHFRKMSEFETFVELMVETSSEYGAPDPNVKIPTYTEPAPDMINPNNSSLLFTNPQNDDTNLLAVLPSQDVADRLLERYWTAVHPIARVVHRQSFERQYARFWDDIISGYEPANSLQAVVFSVLFSAATTLPQEDSLAHLGLRRADIIQSTKTGCEHALTRCNLLKTTRIDTIQALVIYLTCLCRSDINRSHAALVSMAIRIAECASLHRDGSAFGLHPIETHVRRLIWYQLCALDMRTCEAVGPRPHIRREDFDTQLPLNVDDADFESLMPPKADQLRWTDITLARIIMESHEMLRQIWIERPKVEKRQTSLTALLRKIEEHRQRMQKTYLPLVDDKSKPAQDAALRLFRLLISRMYLMVLHRYSISAPQTLPDRLKGLILASAITVLEEAIEIETNPAFEQWSWSIKYYQQWHAALILMFEIFQNPKQEAANRIYSILTYVFEIPQFLGLKDKISIILEQLLDRLGQFQKQRKQRLPIKTDQTLGGGVRNNNQSWQKSLSEQIDQVEQRRAGQSTSPQPQPIASSPGGNLPPPTLQAIQNSQPMNGAFYPSDSDKLRGYLPDYNSPQQHAMPPMQTLQQAQKLRQTNPLASQVFAQISPSASPAHARENSPSSYPGAEGGEQPWSSLDWDEFNSIFPPSSLTPQQQHQQRQAQAAGLPSGSVVPGSVPAPSFDGSNNFDMAFPNFNLFPTIYR